jgi:hypothetical protein
MIKEFIMNIKLSFHEMYFGMAVATFFCLGTLLLATSPGFGHGGKGHASAFTPLQALQEATKLYDKLVASGKLSENWETDLTKVEISNRQKGEQKEHVVSFQLISGEPDKVYIFFSADGKYAGSNFTGK